MTRNGSDLVVDATMASQKLTYSSPSHRIARCDGTVAMAENVGKHALGSRITAVDPAALAYKFASSKSAALLMPR
jgi:hypothetical protein